MDLAGGRAASRITEAATATPTPQATGPPLAAPCSTEPCSEGVGAVDSRPDRGAPLGAFEGVSAGGQFVGHPRPKRKGRQDVGLPPAGPPVVTIDGHTTHDFRARCVPAWTSDCADVDQSSAAGSSPPAALRGALQGALPHKRLCVTEVHDTDRAPTRPPVRVDTKRTRSLPRRQTCAASVEDGDATGRGCDAGDNLPVGDTCIVRRPQVPVIPLCASSTPAGGHDNDGRALHPRHLTVALSGERATIDNLTESGSLGLNGGASTSAVTVITSPASPATSPAPPACVMLESLPVTGTISADRDGDHLSLQQFEVPASATGGAADHDDADLPLPGVVPMVQGSVLPLPVPPSAVPAVGSAQAVPAVSQSPICKRSYVKEAKGSSMRSQSVHKRVAVSKTGLPQYKCQYCDYISDS